MLFFGPRARYAKPSNERSTINAKSLKRQLLRLVGSKSELRRSFKMRKRRRRDVLSERGRRKKRRRGKLQNRLKRSSLNQSATLLTLYNYPKVVSARPHRDPLPNEVPKNDVWVVQ